VVSRWNVGHDVFVYQAVLVLVVALMIWRNITRFLKGGRIQASDVATPPDAEPLTSAPHDAEVVAPAGAKTPAPDAPPKTPEVRWVDPTSNPWGVAVLDVRPVTLTLSSTARWAGKSGQGTVGRG